jgi:hypothetical protein
MRASILLLGGALMYSGILRAGDICVNPPTPTLQCIYSNFGPDQSFNPTSGLIVGYSAVAIPFTPAESITLSDIEIAVILPSADDFATFSIYDSINSLPGNDRLESFTFTGPDALSGTYTAPSVQNPFLNGGEEYWIVMDTVSSNAVWNSNTIGTLGAATILAPTDIDPAQWSARTSLSQGTVALDGMPDSPEPGSWLLISGGMAGFLVFIKLFRTARLRFVNLNL